MLTIYTTDLYGPFTGISELRAAIATTTIELPAWQSIYAMNLSIHRNGTTSCSRARWVLDNGRFPRCILS
ncbi:MAG TPA: hypothetical protein VFU63_06080 [Ktedonobacterales bacterium]|nr:hypothetical protein [Ktedonobacterales bacterium]